MRILFLLAIMVAGIATNAQTDTTEVAIVRFTDINGGRPVIIDGALPYYIWGDTVTGQYIIKAGGIENWKFIYKEQISETPFNTACEAEMYIIALRYAEEQMAKEGEYSLPSFTDVRMVNGKMSPVFCLFADQYLYKHCTE